MKPFIPFFNSIKQKVKIFSQQLHFDKYQSQTGRKLALPIEDTISFALFKQKNNIATKKSIYNIFNPHVLTKH